GTSRSTAGRGARARCPGGGPRRSGGPRRPACPRARTRGRPAGPGIPKRGHGTTRARGAQAAATPRSLLIEPVLERGVAADEVETRTGAAHQVSRDPDHALVPPGSGGEALAAHQLAVDGHG